MRRLAITALVVAALAGCGGTSGGSQRRSPVDNRKLLVDVALRCRDLRERHGPAVTLRAALTRDVNALIAVYRDPDAANPRHDLRPSMREASVQLRQGCDPQLAGRLDGELSGGR